MAGACVVVVLSTQVGALIVDVSVCTFVSSTSNYVGLVDSERHYWGGV